MTIVKANTRLGQRLVARGSRYEGKYLNQVYNKWSYEKERAWNYCFGLCCDQHGEEFSIVSHTCHGFSVSWFTSEGMHYVTPHNHYLVVFE